jgi:transcriptional regulator with XRE-family HTH domain
MEPEPEPGNNWKALGEFIRTQRQLTNLTLRQMAQLAGVSNPYLSQVERGIYKPSAEVLKGIADALKLSAQTLYSRAGLLDQQGDAAATDVEAAIRLDPLLTTEQKETLIRVYQGLLGKH